MSAERDALEREEGMHACMAMMRWPDEQVGEQSRNPPADLQRFALAEIERRNYLDATDPTRV